MLLVYAAAAYNIWALSFQIVSVPVNHGICWDAGQELHIQYKADVSACQP